MISGFLAEILFGFMARRNKVSSEFELPAEPCHCGTGVLADAVLDTVKVFFFLFLISVAIGGAIELVGEGNLYGHEFH